MLPIEGKGQWEAIKQIFTTIVKRQVVVFYGSNETTNAYETALKHVSQPSIRFTGHTGAIYSTIRALGIH